MPIFINTSIRRRNSSSRCHGGRFGKNQSCASNRPAPQMHEMPSLRMTILRRVFAHRRNHNPVTQLNLSYLKWTKKLHPCLP